jgi:hypothetical protein
MELKDSGNRRQFDSGAVRDCADGKGRCDLLPLDAVGKICGDRILSHINNYVREGNTGSIEEAIRVFAIRRFSDIHTALLEVAKQYEDGAKKYAERNWETGIPAHCYVDSGVRHYLKFRRGDTDEPHDRAFLWNMLGLWWTHYNKPELIDLPFKEKK